MQKHLQTPYKNWNDYEVVSINQSELIQSVPSAEFVKGKPFYKPLKEDIEKSGLKFPIIVVLCTTEQLISAIEKFGSALNKISVSTERETHYFIWGGSNRIQVARELGYDIVDCILIPDANFDEAYRLQKIQRESYMNENAVRRS